MILSNTKHVTGMTIVPPSRTDMKVVAPPVPTQEVASGLQALRASGVDVSKVERFDWRKEADSRGLLLDPVLMQGSCGNCWAMSSTSALCDRFIIGKNLSGLHLDPLVLTVCEKLDAGCGGGHPAYAGNYFEQSGSAESSSTCPAWKDEWKRFQDNKNSGGMKNSFLPSCEELKCNRKYLAKQGSTRSCVQITDSNNNPLNRQDQITQTITFIKTEIMTKGPVVGAFNVFADFVGGTGNDGSAGRKYGWGNTGGIYINGMYDTDLDKLWNNQPPSFETDSKTQGTWNGWGKTPLGGHAVAILGWDHEVVNVDGKQTDVEYWICKNSWDVHWNEDGYFRYALTKTPTGYNSQCGLCVGFIDQSGQLQGGATKFDVDLSTGPPAGTVFKAKSGGIHVLVWLIPLILIIVAVLLYIWYRKRN